MAERWYHVGRTSILMADGSDATSDLYVLATPEERRRRGFYARLDDGRRVSVRVCAGGPSVLEITEPHGWNATRTEHASARAAKTAGRKGAQRG